MSYCKINIDGKEKGLKFNQMAILEIGERNSRCKFEQGTLQHELYSTSSIVFAGLRGNAFAKDEPEDFTWEMVCDWAESASDEDKNLVVNTLIQSEKYKQTISYQKEQEEQEKKK